MTQTTNYKFISILFFFFITFINCYSQETVIKDTSSNIVNYEIITFKYGTSEITDKGKLTLIKLFNEYLKLDSNVADFLIILQSWSCEKEINKYPDLGIVRCKKVMDFINDNFNEDTNNFYIDYRNYPINNDCDIPIGVIFYYKPLNN